MSTTPHDSLGVPRRGNEGYNLVILVVAVAVLNIGIAAALPIWSTVNQREKEEELIFRGLQYAEAIRVCQLPNRLGRLPVKLEELIEVEPRCIRQLYPNPMTEDGRWGLILETGGGRRGGNNPRDRIAELQERERRRNEPQQPTSPGGPTVNRNGDVLIDGAGEENGQERVNGPIKGVYSPEGDTAIKTWFDTDKISEWQFTYDLLQATQGAGGNADPTQQRPVNAGNLGRPFPPGVQVQTAMPVPGGAGGGGLPGGGSGDIPGAIPRTGNRGGNTPPALNPPIQNRQVPDSPPEGGLGGG